jgi:redox-sensing transcriptional repressor
MTLRENKKLPRASVLRLELYLEMLEQLEADGCEFVTSAEIGAATGISAVKVRQDFFHFETEGKPKVGYEVAQLGALIRSVLDLETPKNTCLIGYGNLGRALVSSSIWSRAGFKLAAIFDRDTRLIGNQAAGLRVRNVTEIFGVVKAEQIIAGVIAVPAQVAQETADMMVGAGIRAIWNFAPVKLHVPDDVVVENQSLAWGLITLSYAMKSNTTTDQTQEVK